VDTGQLSKEEAARFRSRHILVNALGGVSDEVEVDVDQLKLATGDRVLLCSDGLSDLVTDDAIRHALTTCPGSAEACQSLVDLALERGGTDNVTVIVASYMRS
jgi:serine/threonine protein phosphatase PrpC